jgi:NAD(P)-dependent dehydrogenase (short-subunit alcohol dehydrogenase family)
MEIQGLSTIVTGGASGLGGATAAMLASRGASVAIFDLQEEAGPRHADAIGALFIKTDVSSEDSVTSALAEAERAHGVPRVLVNCAGIGTGTKTVARDFAAHPLKEFRRTIEVNLVGTFNVLSKFAARLAQAEVGEEERGVIINTASVAAFEGQVGQAAYSASKAGIVGLTLPVARDLAQHRIRVMTIAPGLFSTPLLQTVPEEGLASLAKQVPFPSRLGKPEEFAQLVESIVANPMLNGEVIRLDGAIRMAPR